MKECNIKTLLVDIETSPSTAYIWSLWGENIPLARLIDSSTVLCWSAKWLDEKGVMFDSIMDSPPKRMIEGIHKLLEEADAVVHYNGNRFDLPILNREFIKNGHFPPAPYRSIDLLTTVKRKFRFISNKLDYVCEHLGLGKKHTTDFKLWVDCMAKDPEAWKKMKEYNIQDVLLLEKLFHTIRPWITNLPNFGLYQVNAKACPTCGSESLQKRGFSYTNACKYQRYTCNACGSWFRDGVNVGPKPADKFMHIPV